eukprot:CAMPEP_0197872484 /NCGR_PEP_ID=MMETSP1439-20131203/2593_1 /TAXON_ID=66791 /ORGANISM="Gonyaulax spinifera, Strain CCMP409" /LENGTH=50 /DNA_ID=CAMNT_0043491483 /DNA_START=7 /DNA_END=156 /DNA_ORIENTATION=-
MSTGWMQQVANMPAREPVAKGFTAFQAWLSAIAARTVVPEGCSLEGMGMG